MLSLVVLLAASLHQSMDGASTPAWPDHFVVANGIRIHYWRTETPNKPVLIMAHGSSDDGRCWTNLAKEFAADFDIILYDARGHGLTDPPSGWDAADVQVEDLAGLIRELKIVKPVIMGHSMGSSAAAWFSARYPDVPRAVVLEDPGLVPNPATASAANADRDKRRAQILEGNNKTEAQLIAQCMKNSPKWGQSECELWAPSKRLHHPNTALGTIGSRPPVKDLLPKITAPTLILKADAQGELRQKNEEIAALLPKGKIVHIVGAGHNVRRENKAQTVEVLRAFLASI